MNIADRHLEYYKVLSKWLELKHNNFELSKPLLKKGYKSVAIYGCGEMGKNLCRELLSTSVKIVCLLDQAPESEYFYFRGQEIKIINKIDFANYQHLVDAVIVTPFYDFESIQNTFQNFPLDHIISLKNLIEDFYNDEIGVLYTDKKIWEENAQEDEFLFHKQNLWRQSKDFLKQSRLLFEHFGLTNKKYENKTIIDLGAGSKLRTKYFSDSRIIAIEPLADRFLKEIEWCDLNEADQVYSVAAEDRIEACIGQADLLISINVLDHCYNFEKVIENIYDYLSDDGMAFLSFDKHLTADLMHPLQLTEAICGRIFTKYGFDIQKMTQGFGGIFGNQQTYGHGPYCMNYWLTKAK